MFFDGLRPPLGAAFLAAYAWSIFSPGPLSTGVFLASGALMWALSVPWASSFHRGLTLVAFATLGVTLATGRFDAGTFYQGMPDYFNVVAVLLVLSVAGYPIRAARYEAQIRALVAALVRKGASVGATSGVLGHVLGAVLDVGAFVLIDVILNRAAPRARVRGLVWSARAFSFAPLWTNLNVFTAITISLTGASYPALLATTLPFALPGVATTLLFAQREKDEVERPPPAGTLDRGAAAVLLYPVLLVAAVALVNVSLPGVPLTAAITLTVAAIVTLIAAVAVALLRRLSPATRLAREARGTLTASHAEFALFGSAGILVLSLQSLGALEPLGDLFSSLPPYLVAPALMFAISAGFLIGIHVVPMVFLINAAFPLTGGPAPALWATALIFGAQAVLLITPFSSAVTMLSRLTGLHPLQIGPKRNLGFSVALFIAAALYLGAVTLLLF